MQRKKTLMVRTGLDIKEQSFRLAVTEIGNMLFVN